MFAWFKKLKNIMKWYSRDLAALHERIDSLEKIIRERTDISVDIGYTKHNHIIVVGQYKNAGYVQSYSVDTPEFGSLIQHLNQMKKYGVIHNVDAPPTFKYVVEHL